MSKEQIGRLQGLLERVQARAAAPRTNGDNARARAHAAYAAEPALDSVPVELESIPAAPATPPMHAHAQPQAAYESEPPPADNYGSDVEVSSELIEVEIDIDEPMAMESGAQPIAQPTMPPEDLEEDLEEAPSATQPSQHPVAYASSDADEVTQSNVAMPPLAPANEIEEPTPSSSRRPIAGEEPAPAYEEESSPRHTPPPESGKQVAAPSVHPPSRKPSAPPPSLEGHTLIGGWREPGLGAPLPHVSAGASPGGMGVRVPAPGPGTQPPPTVVQPAAAQASGTRLTADVTKPEHAASANVASFQGAAPVAKPTTLGELLDLTLSL